MYQETWSPSLLSSRQWGARKVVCVCAREREGRREGEEEGGRLLFLPLSTSHLSSSSFCPSFPLYPPLPPHLRPLPPPFLLFLLLFLLLLLSLLLLLFLLLLFLYLLLLLSLCLSGRGRHSKDKRMFLLYLHAISVINNKGTDSSHILQMEFSTKVSSLFFLLIHVSLILYMFCSLYLFILFYFFSP